MYAVQYVLESVICCALFVVLYKLLLEGRVSHRVARIYLVTTAILGVIIPIMELPIYPANTLYVEMPIITNIVGVSQHQVVDDSVQNTTDWGRMMGVVALAIYLIVVISTSFVLLGDCIEFSTCAERLALRSMKHTLWPRVSRCVNLSRFGEQYFLVLRFKALNVSRLLPTRQVIFVIAILSNASL